MLTKFEAFVMNYSLQVVINETSNSLYFMKVIYSLVDHGVQKTQLSGTCAVSMQTVRVHFRSVRLDDGAWHVNHMTSRYKMAVRKHIKLKK